MDQRIRRAIVRCGTSAVLVSAPGFVITDAAAAGAAPDPARLVAPSETNAHERAVRVKLGEGRRIIRVPYDQPTIQAGIDAATDGDTVLVAPETYVEKINFNGKAITLSGQYGARNTILLIAHPMAPREGKPKAGAAQDTLDMAFYRNSAVLFDHGEGARCVFDGFTLDGGVFLDGASPTLRYNIISGINGADASPIIENNEFRGEDLCSGGALFLVGKSSPRIDNNLFHHNDCAAIALDTDRDAAPAIYNNTVAYNTAGLRLRHDAPYERMVVANNIFAYNEYDLDNRPPAGPDARARAFPDAPLRLTWTHNLVFWNDNGNPQVRALIGKSGNLGSDPMFVIDEGTDFCTHDYNLKPGSPAIDAGSATGLTLPAYDADLQPRIRPGRRGKPATVDIGAFEAAPAGAPANGLKYWRACTTTVPTMAPKLPFIDFAGEPRFLCWADDCAQKRLAEDAAQFAEAQAGQ